MERVLCALLLCSMSVMPTYNQVSQEDIAKVQAQQQRLVEKLTKNNERFIQCGFRLYRCTCDQREMELLMYEKFNSGEQK